VLEGETGRRSEKEKVKRLALSLSKGEKTKRASPKWALDIEKHLTGFRLAGN